MDEEFDPDHFLISFALVALAKGWSEVTQPDFYGESTAIVWRVGGFVMIAALVIDLRIEAMAWGSVLHFTLKYLGTYHGCRLLAWAVAMLRLGWIKRASVPARP